jgi:hypothetical protein
LRELRSLAAFVYRVGEISMDSLLVVIVVGIASLVFYIALLAFIWSLRPRCESAADSPANGAQ